MQKLTPDFVYAQTRVAGVAIIAYLSGKGIFTPADAGLATAILGAFGPIVIPWAFSMYASWGVVKVSADSVAASVAAVENAGGEKTDMKLAVELTPTPKP